MSMFNWQAGADESVVSIRIWIYFCIAGPLTAVVLVIWRLFLSNRRKVSMGDIEQVSSSTKGILKKEV